MGLGEKLRQTRLEQGMTQRQLCGDSITRNMLSQIENGTASPSVSTLCYLAHRLQKPVSYFLEEEMMDSENTRMEAAWSAFEMGKLRQVLDELDSLQKQGREAQILRSLTLLALAQNAVEEKKNIYALECLEKAQVLEEQLPFIPELRQRRLFLQARIPECQESVKLPEFREELLCMAEVFLKKEEYAKAVHALEIVDERTLTQWQLLRGTAALELQDYETAEFWLTKLEKIYPKKVIPLLERCYREQAKYEKAYFYAIYQRKMT